MRCLIASFSVLLAVSVIPVASRADMTSEQRRLIVAEAMRDAQVTHHVLDLCMTRLPSAVQDTLWDEFRSSRRAEILKDRDREQQRLDAFDNATP